MDIGATPLPPTAARPRHPIDIFCVPREQRVRLQAA
jgi:hypothetical protein